MSNSIFFSAGKLMVVVPLKDQLKLWQKSENFRKYAGGGGGSEKPKGISRLQKPFLPLAWQKKILAFRESLALNPMTTIRFFPHNFQRFLLKDDNWGGGHHHFGHHHHSYNDTSDFDGGAAVGGGGGDPGGGGGGGRRA